MVASTEVHAYAISIVTLPVNDIDKAVSVLYGKARLEEDHGRTHGQRAPVGDDKRPSAGQRSLRCPKPQPWLAPIARWLVGWFFMWTDVRKTVDDFKKRELTSLTGHVTNVGLLGDVQGFRGQHSRNAFAARAALIGSRVAPHLRCAAIRSISSEGAWSHGQNGKEDI